MSLFFLVYVLACGGGATVRHDPVVAEALSLQPCEVCGMVLREQPAPRGQVLRRDGHRAFLCSIGDLRAYLQAPSPHGAAVAAYVEVLAPQADLTVLDTAPHPWVPADEAYFVFGVQRPEVMGVPALVFGDEAAARAAAQRLGTQVADWTAVSVTPFNRAPAGSTGREAMENATGAKPAEAGRR